MSHQQYRYWSFRVAKENERRMENISSEMV